MYKTLGEYNWSGELLNQHLVSNGTELNSETLKPNIEIFESTEDTKSISESAAEFHLTLESLKSVNDCFLLPK